MKPEDLGVTDTHDLGDGSSWSWIADNDGNRIGIHVWHQCLRDYGPGTVIFDNEAANRMYKTVAKWTLVSADPLTIAPSIHCLTCGHHGFIRDGVWIPA